MAGNLINTLYPPIADTFMPAFVNTSEGYILFSLSPYNTADEITRIHISLVDKNTNKYAFQNKTVPNEQDGIYVLNGIMIRDFAKLDFDETSGLYRCPIEASFLKQEFRDKNSSEDSTNAHFKTETYYQAQVRLDKSTSDIDPATYLLSDRQFFSEWSRVILLRPIPEPLMYFNAWDETIPNATLSGEGIAYENGINGVSRKTIPQINLPTYNPGLVPIAGQIYWESSSTGGVTNTEFLDNYKITIYESGDLESPILETETIYTGDKEKDSIYYLADLNNGNTGTNYTIHIDAETRNGYQWWDERTIVLALYDTTPFELNWEFTKIKVNSYGDTLEKIATEEDGYVRGHVTSVYDMPPGYLYIYRASSADNFLTNEIIQVTAENGSIDETFEDRTVCSLIQYRYRAQYKMKHGSTLTHVDAADEFIYPDFYDMLILRQDKQLAVRFDEQLQSLKPVVNRVKIDTLGGRYPRFAENARMNYKQFQISGLISAQEDFNRRFLSEKDEDIAPTLEAYDDHIGNVWEIRNDTLPESTDNPQLDGVHDTYLKDNWYLEREFREKAMAWLNDGEPKLFRSMTEGNMIVILTDINLTPNRTIGRMLYNFSATAYEIADGMNYEDIVGYGIIKRRDDEAEELKYHGSGGSDEESTDYTKVERISQYILPEGKNLEKNLITESILTVGSPVESWVDPITILDLINSQYTGIFDNRKLKTGSIRLRDLRIQFTTKPRYLDPETLSTVEDPEEGADYSNYLLGYKFKVKIAGGNTEETRKDRIVFVNQKGYYQIPSDLAIESISFYRGDAYQLDYILTYQLEYNSANLASKTEKIRDVVGQYAGIFYPLEEMGEAIRRKYSYVIYKNNKVLSEELMENWSSISFDVTPYAVFEMIEKDETEYQQRMVGRTGVYNLMTDFPTQEFRFLGRRMVQAPADNRPHLDEWEFILDESVFGEYSDETNYWYRLLESDSSSYGELTDSIVYLGLRGTYDLSEPYDYWGLIDNPTEDEECRYGYLKVENIKNPQYNTIYKIVDKNRENPVYLIYYVDKGWYQAIPQDEDFNTIIARVPIYGMINYRGTVIKKTYS